MTAGVLAATLALWLGPTADRPPTEQPPPTRTAGASVDPPTSLHPAINRGLARLQTLAAHVARSQFDDAARRAAAERARVVAASAPRPAVAFEPSSGRCGGDLPSCSIMECESGGNVRAENPTSSASGKWQITSGSWGGYGGYARASDAPESVQDARARELWAGGDGRSHWVC